MKKICFLIFGILLISLASCKTDKTEATKNKPKKIVKIPSFKPEYAYKFVEEQLAFGHRYPGSEGHGKLIDYLSDQLKGYGANVVKQPFKADFLGKTGVDATNVIGSFNPDHETRVLLAAHFDSRLVAEKDENAARQDQPIMGADDGASGVAVLLEIARLIHENDIDLGVDIVFFDAEDQGQSGETAPPDTWCLGSQYWSKNPHQAGYKAKFGILLDMVGAKNAQFGKEQISTSAAPVIVKKVWSLASNMGFDQYFKKFKSGPIMDDHYYVIKNRRIPMIDIINTPLQDKKPEFGHYHHTHMDDIDIIDQNTLKAVGKVVTATIYNESMGRF